MYGGMNDGVNGGDDSDLIPLHTIAGSARVVAIGEPTHGGHEPLAFRNRLVRYLVEHEGFTAVGIESFHQPYRLSDLTIHHSSLL